MTARKIKTQTPSPRRRGASRLDKPDSTMLEMVASTLANTVLVNKALQSVALEAAKAAASPPPDPAAASLFTSPAATLAMIFATLRSQHIELDFAANQTKQILERAGLAVQL